jgi:dimethylhistidine N-methyltransferase
MLKQEIEDGQASLADPAFRADVLTGLAARPRAIPARWFYDRRGSELFEAITELPEYYPTRTETTLLLSIGRELGDLAAENAAVVEFGSGSSTKTPILLRAIDPAAYVPIDISGDFLRQSARELSQAFPGLPVYPVEADFLRPVPLPPQVEGMPKLGFFPGSTIGNMQAFHAVNLLRAMRDWLGDGARLLIGMDRVKSEDVLIPAYDDAQGVTAAFNLNLLERINRELGGNIPVDGFRHRAIWNDDAARIEMHLEATRDMDFEVDGRAFSIEAGETIHTENSHKYGRNGARQLLRAGGWTPIREWTDPREWFGLILCEAQPTRMAP